MKRFVNTLIAWGPAGLFAFAIADGLGVPTPGGLDAFLLIVAYNRPQQAYLNAGLTILGSLIGCMGLFFISRRAGEKMLTKYRARTRFLKLERWFQDYGLLTVFIPALVPIPMPLKFFIICAGVFEVSPAAMFVTLVASRVPRYLGLAYLGSHGMSVKWFVGHALYLLAFAVALFLFLYLLVAIARKRRRLTGRE
jgi:membrane protein YqaA with SNARE-associated domain